jgi:hypothetical protein
MADRYGEPMSKPCRFSVVGLWLDQKTSRRSSYGVRAGSYMTLTASAWPVVSVQTSSYDGFATVPPV